MSVLLVRPQTPQTSRSGIVSVQYPLNLGYLASYLRQHGVACTVRDFEVEPYAEEEFLAYLDAADPGLVGFSCMTPHILHAAELARLVKERRPDILTVVGGVHPSAIPEDTLGEFPQFDVAVCGEGEQTLLELHRARAGGGSLDAVAGIVYRDGDSTLATAPRALAEDIDRFPFPDRNLVDLARYKKSHVSRGFSRTVLNIAEIVCSRGCPYRCIFCASKVTHSTRVRFRSPDNIIAEMEALIGDHGIQHFSFLDDTFSIRLDLLRPVCEYMRSRGVTFDCFTRANDIDEEKAALLVSAGCKKISFGIESGSPKVLSLLKKGITLEHIERAFRAVRKAGLPIVEATFLIGSHPDETREDIELTRKLIFRLKPDLMGIFITIPYPGTELNRILKERGLLKQEHWEEFTLFFGKPSWRLGDIPTEELQQILKKTYRQYYFSAGYVWKRLLAIRSLSELRYYFGAGASLLRSLSGHRG